MIRLLLHTETERRQSFTVFALIALASLFCAKALWYAPVMWLVMIAYLQLSGSRLYLASLVGLLTPYWLVLPYVVIEDRYDLAEQYVEELTTLQNVADFSAVATAQWAAAGVVMLLVLFGMIRYYRHKDYDRHRLRMAYNGYAVLFVFSLLLFLFQPQLVWLCLAGMIVCGSPFITRLFTLLS